MWHAVLQARRAGDAGTIARAVARRAGHAAAFGLVGAILMLGGAATQARTRPHLPEDATAVEIGPTAKPVAAWTDFCNRMPAECTVDLAEPATIPLNAALWRTLTSVNRRVNARIKPITDQAHWGVIDRWDYPDDGFGDCEDYQLLKRRMLVERGLPRRALRMTVVIDDIGEGHAVLMVRTDRGDFILDNKTNTVLSWRSTGYAYIKREGQDGSRWVSLDGGASPVTTANR
ncbi:transglutaminase-like cysteine peptidase [Methylobacterium planeticum]|uniref:Transglutaminase-like cysteine peptidase n=1 Tax=Methylobacterium planeticum TaxID=2615211 RepID=A0A6N6MWD7_9HYPH|nr:transglutaminase-like cysteine peptidase [Methylobacterium planeticum]KAB1074200.1 transglutaminase-like cysteine peptidase [Methylobacterium planeticum]